MEAVAPGHHLALQLPVRSGLAETDHRPVVSTADARQLDRRRVEQQLSPARKASGNQVLDHLLLAVHGDGLAGQAGEVDAVTVTAELQVHAAVLETFAVQPIREAQPVQQADGAVLEDAGPDAGFHVLPGSGFQDHGLDAGPFEQVGEDEPRRAGSNDPDLGLSGRLHPGDRVLIGPASRWLWRSWAARARSIQTSLAPR